MATQADGSKATEIEPEEVPVAKAADTLGQLLNRVAFGGESFVITRNGKKTARLVPMPQESEPATATG